jgi:isoaspartyl peptidase/L-asparaginase-like protein (Ntn-hydrolase superfamily)
VPEPVLAVHGGAGAGEPDPDRLAARWEGLTAALTAGRAVLARDGTALDAVVAAVEVLEDHPEFNAGRGSALTTAGRVEMDASVACGETLRAGAVAAVTGVRHPVAAARAVLEDARHVILVAGGAEAFAREHRLEFCDPDWFVTERRRAEQVAASEGTVGAVALDRRGHLAAATSTGGRTGQLPGRVGDSPIIGAGTWADDRTCAVSATGAGEAFIRAAFAHEVDARLRLASRDLDAATVTALERVVAAGGRGGCIALDATGRLAMPFTTASMHRGFTRGDRGPLLVASGPGECTEIA